jgi:hypothetical protein
VDLIAAIGGVLCVKVGVLPEKKLLGHLLEKEVCCLFPLYGEN